MKPAAFVDRHVDPEPAPDWSDTVPACFRSEAFAEDLQPFASGTAGAAPVPAPLRAPRRGARAWRWVPPWGAALALIGRRPAAIR